MQARLTFPRKGCTSREITSFTFSKIGDPESVGTTKLLLTKNTDGNISNLLERPGVYVIAVSPQREADENIGRYVGYTDHPLRVRMSQYLINTGVAVEDLGTHETLEDHKLVNNYRGSQAETAKFYDLDFWRAAELCSAVRAGRSASIWFHEHGVIRDGQAPRRRALEQSIQKTYEAELRFYNCLDESGWNIEGPFEGVICKCRTCSRFAGSSELCTCRFLDKSDNYHRPEPRIEFC